MIKGTMGTYCPVCLGDSDATGDPTVLCIEHYAEHWGMTVRDAEALMLRLELSYRDTYI